MARSKTHKEDEDLRGKIRELEKINKALKRRLRQLEKNRHLWEQWQLDSDEPKQIEEPATESCPECQHGALLTIDLGIKTLLCCSICTYRKTRNK